MDVPNQFQPYSNFEAPPTYSIPFHQHYPDATNTPGFYPGFGPIQYGIYDPCSYQGFPMGPQLICQQRFDMVMVPEQPRPFTKFEAPSTYSIPFDQSYPDATGTPGFYPEFGHAQYGTYGPCYAPLLQYPPSVPAVPAMTNPPPQQQWAPAPQQILTTRKHEQVELLDVYAQMRIRDPSWRDRDITKEIMPDRRTTCTPTPLQSAVLGSEVPLSPEKTSVNTNVEELQLTATGGPEMGSLSRAVSESHVIPITKPDTVPQSEDLNVSTTAEVIPAAANQSVPAGEREDTPPPQSHLPSQEQVLDNSTESDPSSPTDTETKEPQPAQPVTVEVKVMGAKEEEQCQPEAMHTQELFFNVGKMLNRVTPETLQQLTVQMQEFTIDTEERLQGVVNLVYEKAVTDPINSSSYAKMSYPLMRVRVPTASNPETTVMFRTLLLNRCQQEFQKDKEEQQHLTKKAEDAKCRARQRSIGNVKLIGELFKLKMLTEPIIHHCLDKLLKDRDEESLECLCLLLYMTGRKLDTGKAKNVMDQYFQQLEMVIEDTSSSPHIRIMLQDVVNLRLRNWVHSRND